MSSNVFEKLLHNSRNLAGNTGQNDIQSVELNFGQLVDQSTLLSSKFDKQHNLEPTTQYFLAQRKINIGENEKNLKKIESAVIFEPSEMIKNTDIESYLRQRREELIKETKDTTDTV